MGVRKLQIANTSSEIVYLGLEPEGDFVDLASGARCEVLLLSSSDTEDDLELEIGGDAVRLYSQAGKQVWQNAIQRR